jgi:hypothetical protein
MPKRSRGLGFTLLETSMVLGINFILVAGGMTAYSAAHQAQQISDTEREVAAVNAAVRMLADTRGIDGLDTNEMGTAMIRGSMKLPYKWVSGSGAGIQSPYGPAAAHQVGGRDWELSLYRVPRAACIKIASTMADDELPGLVNIRVDEAISSDGQSSPQWLSMLQGACVSSGNSLRFSFTA